MSFRVKPRSTKIILTNEARVLRALRLEHKLSMREAAARIGISDSTIAHVETGRMNPPKHEKLKLFLDAYGGIKPKSFYERVRTFEDSTSPKQELTDLVKRANASQLRVLLNVAKGLLR
jgi:HTH-type transcriptional regulator, competence development regulator